MSDVLYAVIVKYPDFGYCQVIKLTNIFTFNLKKGTNFIMAFILCFTNEENAFLMFCHLIDNILPKNFFAKTAKGLSLIGF